MKKIEIEAKIEQRDIVIVGSDVLKYNFKKRASEMFPEGEIFIMKLQEISQSKTIQQNRWYWKMCRDYIMPSLVDMGYNVINEVEASEFIRGQYLQKVYFRKVNGVEKQVISTKAISELSKEEMGDLMEKIIIDFAKLGYVIPDGDPTLKTT